MKILVVGDPHGNLKKIKNIPTKEIDLILMTGDLGKADLARKFYFENLKREKEGLLELEYDSKTFLKIYEEIHNSTINIVKYFCKKIPVYSILGNVGTNMIKDSEVKKEEKEYGVKLPYLRKNLKKLKNFHLVRNGVREIGGLRIGFLEYFEDICWYKEFKEEEKEKLKKVKKETKKAKKILENFRKVDILICHQPPYGYLDKVSSKYNPPKHWVGKHAGSKVILNYIKKYPPKYVFCGHIHEAKGKAKIRDTLMYNVGYNGDYLILDTKKDKVIKSNFLNKNP